VRPVKTPVTLAQMKAEPDLAEMAMIRLSRISVSPVTEAEWKTILKMAGE
jgi:predicted RNA-binding protein with PUA-like domain